MDGADSNYDHMRPRAGSPPPPYAYLQPFSSNEERLVQRSLEINMLPNSEIQKIVRPELPQVVLFRPKYGYRTTQPGLQDVLDVGRQAKVSDAFSGGPGSYSGSSRNVQGTW